MSNFVMKGFKTKENKSVDKARVLIVTRGGQSACGFVQLGMHLEKLLVRGDYLYSHCNVNNLTEFVSEVSKAKYQAIIVNGNTTTLPFINKKTLYKYDIPLIKFGGDTTQRIGNDFDREFFDFWLIEDENFVLYNPYVFKVGRSLFSSHIKLATKNNKTLYDVASFGFALEGKGFKEVLYASSKLKLEKVLMHLPKSDYLDPNGDIQKRVIDELYLTAQKLNIKLTVTKNLLKKEELIKHLSSARELFFLYEENRGKGSQLSGVLEYAFSTGRNVYLSNSSMFRHALYYLPAAMRIESRLNSKNITNCNPNYLPILHEWSPENFNWRFNKAISSILDLYESQGRAKFISILKKKTIVISRKILESFGLYKSPLQTYYYNLDSFSYSLPKINYEKDFLMNRCLTVKSLREFKREIHFFKKICPDLVTKKNQLGFSQYALLLKYLIANNSNIYKMKILAIGSYEDILVLALKRLGAYVEEVDPNINYILEEFVNKPSEKQLRYDLIFSISVLEHVENDINFLQLCEEKLKKGGVQYHTLDYLPNFENLPLPKTHFRFYSEKSLENIEKNLKYSKVYKGKDYQNPLLDFEYNDLTYCLASIFFKKM